MAVGAATETSACLVGHAECSPARVVGRSKRARGAGAAWAAGAGPDLDAELRIDFDATITIAHSEKENAAKTWKRTFGFHPLLAFLDRPDVSGGEALAGLLRAGNAGSKTAADHVQLLGMALAALPAQARPGDPTSPRVLARSDSAGASHVFAAACRKRGVGFSFGFPVDGRIQAIVDLIPEACWAPAIEADDQIRDGAWVAEATGLIDLSSWPQGSRLILRKERPHPGAQLSFTDIDGHRVIALLTDTGPGVVPGQAAGLELRHRQHARVEDRIREAQATGWVFVARADWVFFAAGPGWVHCARVQSRVAFRRSRALSGLLTSLAESRSVVSVMLSPTLLTIRVAWA